MMKAVKKIVVFVSLLLFNYSLAQYPIRFGTTTNVNNVNVTSGTDVIATPDYITYTGDNTYSGTAQVNHEAKKGIRIGGRFRAGGFTGTGSFRAKKINAGAEVVAYSGTVNNGTLEVGEYDKLELGLKLNDEYVEQQINLFLMGANGIEPGTQGINPFDPDQISFNIVPKKLSFTVSTPSGPLTIPDQTLPTRYGFYYQDFIPNAQTNTWDEKPTEFPWRFRFAAPLQGGWQFTMNVIVANYGTISVPMTVNVNVVTSNNKGFLEVGVDRRHFRYSKTKESFFGVGCNIFTPSDICNVSVGGNCDDGKHYNSYLDLDEIERFKGHINLIGSKSANYFRMNLGPEGFDAEQTYDGPFQNQMLNGATYPKLKNLRKYRGVGNYQNNQCYLYEFDKILELCKSREMKIHLVLTAQNLFQYGQSLTAYTGGNGAVRWPSNAYYSGVPNGVTGVNEPIDFFTNATAKSLFKKKLRYYIARWGYSTELANYTLTSETDGIGNIEADPVTDSKAFPDPFYNSSQYQNTILDWSNEMATYMRVNLQSVHLIGNNFTGAIGSEIAARNLYYTSSIFDFNSINRYSTIKNTMYQGAEAIYTLTGDYDKPLVLSESGALHDNIDIMKNTDVDFHNNMWYSACSGIPTVGLHWEWRNGMLPFPPDITTDYTDHFTAIRNFMSSIDFENEEYYLNIRSAPPFAPNNNNSLLSDDKKFEFFCMTNVSNPNGNADKAFGWVHNRSHYYGTLLRNLTYVNDNGVTVVVPCPGDDDGIPCSPGEDNCAEMKDDNDDKDCKDGVQTYPANSEYFRIINIKPITRFKIDWYNTRTGNIFTSTHENTLFDNFGVHYLKIQIPFTSSETQNYDVAFKLYEDPLFNRIANTIDSTEHYSLSDTLNNTEVFEVKNDSLQNNFSEIIKNNNLEDNNIINVFPNPHSNLINVTSSKEIQSISIVNSLGEMIYYNTEPNFYFTINTTGFSNGVFMVEISTLNEKVVKRIVKIE